MKLHTTGLAALSLAIALGLSGCGGKSDSAPGAGSAPATPAAAGDKVAAEISGAGASFIFPLVSKWSADYNAATGARINYQSIGSGGGIAQIKAGTVDFGSSDKCCPPRNWPRPASASSRRRSAAWCRWSTWKACSRASCA